MPIRPETIAPRGGIYKRGFGLRAEITGDLNADYHSKLIERIRGAKNRIEAGGVEIELAREFGFCYGVDKAVDFAYETRRKFPDRRIFLTAEIIHNPRVNARLIDRGIEFLSGQYARGTAIEEIGPRDVVLLPAFGVAVEQLERLRQTGCILVDTTCGSVVHVWKRVEQYARDGFTSLIHGKYDHEETIATASHSHGGGKGAYLVVLDREETGLVCDFIRGRLGAETLAKRFERAASPGFDFARDLERIGVANQTTMLSSESLEIAAMVREAMIERHGSEAIEDHFRSIDTTCSATQERQDALTAMMKNPPDLAIVIGGFNSSNTYHLCEIAAKHCRTYHIEDARGLISRGRIRHKPHEPLRAEPIDSVGWYPVRRPLRIGVTAGASTPNRVVGEVIEKLLEWAQAPGETSS